MIEVTLTPEEMAEGARLAQGRHERARREGRQRKFGQPSEQAHQHEIIGCQGEIAASKGLGLPTSARKETWGDADLRAANGERIEVRTGSSSKHKLLLHKEDHPDMIALLVTWEGDSRFRLRGWIYVRDGQKREYWSDPVGGRGAYFVPQIALRPMFILPGANGKPEA